ncbi:MAG: hypothetical protein DMG58_35415 [Acidobacteria bacterium]|nr:MAG: hypothetical protein DMG58_35415 [Acidobacteriota bacterium]
MRRREFLQLPAIAALPTSGQRKKIAAITTTYFVRSHADDIITRFLEGYVPLVPLVPFLQRSGVNQCGFPPVRKLFLTPADMGELSTFDWKSHHGLLLGRERLPNGLWN